MASEQSVWRRGIEMLRWRRCSLNLLFVTLTVLFTMIYYGHHYMLTLEEDSSKALGIQQDNGGWGSYVRSYFRNYDYPNDMPDQFNSTSAFNAESYAEAEEVDSEPAIKILSWTPLNMRTKQQEENWFPAGFEVCRNYYPAPWTPCEYTMDKSQIEDSDAVLFRGRRIDLDNLPTYRTPNQKWLFYEFEPPYKVWMYTNLTKIKDKFNLTSTYSRDSDVFKNGFIKKCWPDPERGRKVIKTRKNGGDFAAKKKGLVAWFVSVCNTQSKREKYVKKLSKYIPIDIYGECGTLKCGSSLQRSAESDACDKRLLHEQGSYKFYLAFENSLCDDYITEKLWKLQRYDVVPIVMGAMDYTNMRPKGTFIDVRDFETPKALADYLWYLDEHDDEYNQLVLNKISMKCRQVEPNIPWHCRVCNYLKENKDNIEIKYDIARFWGMKRCRRPEEFFTYERDDDFAMSTK